MATKEITVKIKVDSDYYPLVLGRIRALKEVLSIKEIKEDVVAELDQTWDTHVSIAAEKE